MEIKVTEKAAEHVKKHLKDKNDIGLRLGIKEVGCSGLTYVYGYASAVDSEDIVFDQMGIKIIVSRQSLPFVKGSTLDFDRSGLNTAFKVLNPNAKAICGCGESFTVKEEEN